MDIFERISNLPNVFSLKKNCVYFSAPILSKIIEKCQKLYLPLAIPGARRRGESVRVWPLSALDTRDASEMHARVQRQFGDEAVVRPRELVTASMDRVESALLATFGSTLIVASDELAGSLIREHGVRCVTLSGNVHEPALCRLRIHLSLQHRCRPKEVEGNIDTVLHDKHG